MPEEAGSKELDKSETLEEALSKNAHLVKYMEEMEQTIGPPVFYASLDRSLSKVKKPNIIYPVGDPIFIGLYKEDSGTVRYNAVQPELTKQEEKFYEAVTERLIEVAHTQPIPPEREDVIKVLLKLFDQVVDVSDSFIPDEKLTAKKNPLAGFFGGGGMGKLKLSRASYDKLKYYLVRDRFGFGILEPLLRDPYIEDIHGTGLGHVHLIHKLFGMVKTNIVFNDDLQLDKYLLQESERVERPLSEANPVVDAIMPDGSRANFIYGRDMSLEGSSFTIRKFTAVPISVTQLVNWKTMSPMLAAYMWLCLQHGMSVFICGETASGKTTTLNALSAFIEPQGKIYSVENTPEVTMPHAVWQHLVTRESGKETDVTMFDLLIAALRSRPDYIIVGEIRSIEGNVAFQAMQTGHPVLSTFHAGNITQMIQRVTGDPINVPITSVENLNLVLFQQAVFHEGHFIRRVLDITELERYYAEVDQVSSRSVFNWVPSTDEHIFRGWHNSYILEQKVAKLVGYSDPRKIYGELEIRAKIIQGMVDHGIFNYYDVWQVIQDYINKGELPFDI